MNPISLSTSMREGADSILAKNLVVARLVVGMTQQQLAAAAGVSRATIAQLETGYSDPRLSTIVELARALHLPAIFLLLGMDEIQAFETLATHGEVEPMAITAAEVERMRRLAATGMLKDRVRAARLGAAIARSAGQAAPSAFVGAAIFSAVRPGAGTRTGMLLGQLLAESPRVEPP